MDMLECKAIEEQDAMWIWLAGDGEEVNRYAQFRHEFYMDKPINEDAALCISVDTDYVVWLNGKFVNCGQYDDFPENKAYDELPVGGFLKQGKNVLCILVYHQGENSYQYIKGEPGLVYFLASGGITAASGEDTRCRGCRAYKNGLVPKVSRQLGFTFEYNAKLDDLWTAESYNMGSEWRKARPAVWSNKARRTLYKRPVKKLDIKERAAATIIAQGVFRRIPDKAKTVAQKMYTDFLSTRLPEEILGPDYKCFLPSCTGISLNVECFNSNQGIYLLLDLDREEAGVFNIELDSDSGAVIDVAYGEHLLDLRVMASAGERNFADRYICREGRQNFTHYFTRFGCRYIQLHISHVKTRFILYHAGLLPVEYPVDFKGEFFCSDLLHKKICSVAERTLHLCMHEHYEDTPWREQALYIMDSRNQALCGYYCFGEYEYPEAAVSLMEQSLKSDGYMEMCAPAQPRRTIPSFSMVWFQQLYELYLYSGCIDFVKQMLPAVKMMLGKYVDSLAGALLPTPQGERYWNFYEWADGLDGTEAKDAATRMQMDAPLNLFMHMALNAAEKLFKACNELDDAAACASLRDKMGRAIHTAFWNEEEKAYATSTCEDVRKSHYAELTQALALYTGACPRETAQDLRARLACKDNGFVPITLSYSIFKYEALLQEPETYGVQVFDEIADQWSYMLYNNATSFWETINAMDIFRQGWSFCHGWSAIPVYLYHAYILGIKPTEPGFVKFKAEPACSNIDRAWGVVPTPAGKIHVKRDGTDGNIQCSVTHPDGLLLQTSY